VCLCTSVFVALHGASPARTRAAPQVTSQVTLPAEQRSAPKSGPTHFSDTLTPVKLPYLVNSERSRQARSKRIQKLLLQGAGFSAGTGHNKMLTSPRRVLPRRSIGSRIKDDILDVCVEHSHLLTAYHDIIHTAILPSSYTSPGCSLNKTMVDYIR